MLQQIQNDQQLARISEKLQTVLESCRPALVKNYGARLPTLRPPLEENELNAFETKHRIRLPSGYRAFLNQLGNGGVGPWSGVHPLQEWYDAVGDEVLLSTPFPAAQGAENVIRLERQGEYPGAITVCHEGCSGFILLIITGGLAGRLVGVSLDIPREAWLLRDESFLDWYERWLDSVLAGEHFQNNIDWKAASLPE